MPDSDRLVLFYDSAKYEPDHHHQGERTPFSVAFSDDAGKTWKKSVDLLGGPHEYVNPDCYFTSDGTAVITVSYVQQPWQRERIHLLSIAIESNWFDTMIDTEKSNKRKVD